MTISVVSAQTVLKNGPARLKAMTVTVAGSTAGSINDTATIGGIAAGNQYLTAPNTAGYAFTPAQPLGFATGLVVTPGTGQTIVVDWDG